MSPVKIDPELSQLSFVPVFLDADFAECGLALAGTALVIEAKPGEWRVSAEVLGTDGKTERQLLGEVFTRQSEAENEATDLNER